MINPSEQIEMGPINNVEMEGPRKKSPEKRPLVSIITPAYNEAAIITKNLDRLCAYMKGLEKQYRWEIVVVNDGSKDGTAELADNFAAKNDHVIVEHHLVNKNLGNALQTGFRAANGDYVVVMDLDLSYAEEHIEQLLSKIRETEADIVIASPYMKGGKSTAVPTMRLVLSKVVNRLMKFMAPKNIYTYTGMVRAYKKSFLQKLNLKSSTYSINPEILNKGFILRARIEEIPAHLDWSAQKQEGRLRTSSIRILSGIQEGLMAGFIFRPYIFFMSVGMILFLIAFYILGWILISTFGMIPEVSADYPNFDARFSEAIATVFRERPHAFIVGGLVLIAALQFLGIGFLSLQNKRYFDELFHINTALLEDARNPITK